MSWTVSMVKGVINNAKTITLTYTNGVRSVVDAFEVQGLINDTYIQNRAQVKIDWLNAQDSSFAVLTEGPVTPQAIVVSPPVLSQAEIDQATFVVDYQKLIAINRGVAAGIISPTLPALVALKAKISAEFIPAYLVLL